MKKYILLIGISMLSIGILASVPTLVKRWTPQVQVVTVQKTKCADTIKAEGTVTEQEKTNMNAEYPMVIEKVNVKEGDTVKVGDVIATVNKAETVQAIASVADQIAQYMPDAVQQVLSQQDSPKNMDVSQLPEEVTATASGILSSVNLEEGKLVMPGQAMASISDLSHLCVVASVEENMISGVKKGQSVTVSGDALGDRSYQGKVTSISPVAKSHLNGLSTQTAVDVTISLKGNLKDIRPGYHVDAEITTGDAATYSLLPYEAILQDDDGHEYVLLYQNGRAKKSIITTGKELENGIEIKEGVPDGSYVIYNPSSVKENSKVRISSEVEGWNS